MDEERLIEAMRFGGTGPDAPRGENDLGRFGLGLKTASLSQCRQLRVSSKTAAGIASFMWDIDHIREAGGKWSLLDGKGEGHAEALAILAERPAGTVVAWRKVDFGRHEDKPDHNAFLRALNISSGISEWSFIASSQAMQGARIMLNGRRVAAWDPFLESNEATLRSPEQPLKGPGGRVRVRGFVFPHRDRFRNEAEFEKAGGPEGWTAQQGFYVYRQKRLLSWGGWLGLGGSRAWTREEPSRLARLRIESPIPPTTNGGSISARPLRARRHAAKAVADPRRGQRRKAREVFVHRGQYGPRAKDRRSCPHLAGQSAAGASRVRHPARSRPGCACEGQASLHRARTSCTDFSTISTHSPVDRVWLDVTEQGVPPTQGKSDELIECSLRDGRA